MTEAEKDNPARDTYQATFNSTCTVTDIVNSCTGLIVPSTSGNGQPVSMFVIEFVSGTCRGQSVVPLFNYSVADFNSHFFPSGVFTDSSMSGQFFQNFATSSDYIAQQTRLYAAPGTTISALSINECTLSVSGYLVTP